MQITVNIPVAGGATMSRVLCTKMVTAPSAEGAPLTQEVSDVSFEPSV